MTDTQRGLVVLLPLVLLLGLSCISDLRDRRIPNVLPIGAMLLGITLHGLLAGLQGTLFSASGLLAGLLVMLPFWLLKGLGAGDVKPMGAIGSLLGPGAVLWAGLYSLAAGGIVAVLILLFRRIRGDALDTIRKSRFSFAPAIALGVIGCALLTPEGLVRY